MTPKQMSLRKFCPEKLSYKSKLGAGLCPTHFSINWTSPDLPRESLLNVCNGSAGLKYSCREFCNIN